MKTSSPALLTLQQIWHQFSQPEFSYLVVENARGERTFIEGYRAPDPEGGCMATGVPGALYGRDPWFNAPASGRGDAPEWTFIQGYGENFMVQGRASGRLLRGIEETAHNFKVLETNGNHVYYPKASFKRIESAQVCAGCHEKLVPAKRWWQKLVG